MAENPFGGEASDPFEYQDPNPFADPAVQGSSAAAGGAGAGGGFAGAASSSAGAGNLKAREEALARREAELDHRERELRKREQGMGGYQRPNNWPSFYPMTYHSIKDDIPQELQSLVRSGYVAWMGYAFVLCWNWFCMTVYWFGPGNPGIFVIALLWMFLGAPLSWMLSYKSLYNGARKDRASSFLWYIITWSISIAIMGLHLLGIPDIGSAGVISLIEAAQDNAFAGIVLGISTGLWGICLLFALYTLKRVWAYYKTRGGNEAAKKEVVRDAAKEAASAGV